MDAAALEFLKRILETPSPSGFERPVQDVVRAYVADFADKVWTDLHGNVIAAKNPAGKLRLMLAGHCDQIGLIVSHIDAEGYLYVQPIGGWDPQQLIGQRLTVWTTDGAVPGVMARKPIHLLTDEEQKQVPKLKDLWLDIGAKDKEEAAKLVRIGDPVTLELGFRQLRNNLAYAPGHGRQGGPVGGHRGSAASQSACAAMRPLRREHGAGGDRPARRSHQRLWHRSACRHCRRCHARHRLSRRSTRSRKGTSELGAGPVIYRGPNMNPVVVERLIAAAKQADVAYQLAASGAATGTDANTMQISRAGVATGLVSIPNRYMHSPVELISLDDIDRAATLLAEFALGIEDETDFRP